MTNCVAEEGTLATGADGLDIAPEDHVEAEGKYEVEVATVAAT